MGVENKVFSNKLKGNGNEARVELEGADRGEDAWQHTKKLKYRLRHCECLDR